MKIEEDDIGNLFNIFDRNKDGKISTDEFLATVIGEMNSRRKDIVDRAFKKIDSKNAGEVQVLVLK